MKLAIVGSRNLSDIALDEYAEKVGKPYRVVPAE